MTNRTLKLLAIILLFGFSNLAFAQKPKGPHYFATATDTVYCSKLGYGTTAQGYLESITYTDENGDEKTITGRKNVPDVLTFFQNGVFIDKTPLKADKPESYIRYTARAVDGAIKVYLSRPDRVEFQDVATGEMRTGPSGPYRFF